MGPDLSEFGTPVKTAKEDLSQFGTKVGEDLSKFGTPAPPDDAAFQALPETLRFGQIGRASCRERV